MRYLSYRINERMKDMITDICLFVLRKTNKDKNRCLAQRLSNLCKDYDPEYEENT
jgi:hypothetical protein